LTLKELFGKYRTLNELASMDIDVLDRRIKAGMEGKIRAARSDLKGIESDYKKRVVDTCAVIGVEGKFCKEFAGISKEMGTIPIDFLYAIDIIGDSILKRGGADRYTSHEHLMVMDELNKIKMRYRLSSLPLFQAKFDGVGPNTNLKQALFHQLTSQYGGQLYSIVTHGEIGLEAINMGFCGKTLPVVLYNYATPLSEGILPKPVGVIKVDKKPTKTTVKKALLEMRSQSKKSK